MNYQLIVILLNFLSKNKTIFFNFSGDRNILIVQCLNGEKVPGCQIVSWWVYLKELKTTQWYLQCITNYIIPLHTGGALFHSAPSWPAHSINTKFYTQRKDDHRGLYSLDDRKTKCFSFCMVLVICHCLVTFLC